MSSHLLISSVYVCVSVCVCVCVCVCVSKALISYPIKFVCCINAVGELVSSHIRYFLTLVATGSFSPERRLPAHFCVDFNHFQSIVKSALVHSKTLECSFLNNFRLLFHMVPMKI